MNYEIKRIIESLDNVELKHPFGKKVDVYYVSDKMFALVEHKKYSIVLSLRCDRNLIKTLIEKYDEIMLGHKLNQKEWISIVPSGQLNLEELKGLITHSYLTSKSLAV